MEVRKYPLLLRIFLAWSYLVAKSCLTLCDLINCSLPGSSVHGISQQESWSGLPFLSPFPKSCIALAPMFKSLIYSELQKLLPQYQQSHLPRFLSWLRSTGVQKHLMENSRNKQFIYFESHAILSKLMSSCKTCKSVFMPVPHCSDDCSLVIRSGNVRLCSFLFLKIVWLLGGSLESSYKFNDGFSTSETGILIGMTLNL